MKLFVGLTAAHQKLTTLGAIGLNSCFFAHSHSKPILLSEVPYCSLCLGFCSTVRGILKANWLPKHHSLIPSVVLVALPFKTGLTPSGYAQQEDAIFSQVPHYP